MNLLRKPPRRIAQIAPDTTIIPNDIREIDGKFILEAAGINAGELDILDGSPPCSAFSTAGKGADGWGSKKKYSDVSQENVEDLFFEYIRVLRDIKPKIFVAENVSGLAKGKAKGYLNQILREFKSSGYQLSCKILDAQWLGAPQKRQRTIFVGVRNDLWRDGLKGRLHPKPAGNQITLKSAFEGLVFSDKDRADTDITKYATFNELVKLGPGGQSDRYFQLTKAYPRTVSNCITASAGCLSIAAVRHWNNRAFTVSEVKRVMSVPDDYVLTGSYAQKIERLGRMVPPFMIRSVVQNILSLGVINENPH